MELIQCNDETLKPVNVHQCPETVAWSQTNLPLQKTFCLGRLSLGSLRSKNTSLPQPLAGKPCEPTRAQYPNVGGLVLFLNLFFIHSDAGV